MAARHRRQNRFLWPAAVIFVWYRDDVATTIHGALSDYARPSAEMAGQLAMLAAIALLPVILVAALLLVALNWICRTTQDVVRRALAVVVATLIAARLLVIQPSPSAHVMRPRPAI